jgi:hypothetical protein
MDGANYEDGGAEINGGRQQRRWLPLFNGSINGRIESMISFFFGLEPDSIPRNDSFMESGSQYKGASSIFGFIIWEWARDAHCGCS